MPKSEITIIGSGAATFAAAIRAAEAGAHVTMVERGTLGGTCVNVGCIPSKVRLAAARAAHTAGAHPFAGLGRAELPVDAARLGAQQQALVEQLRDSNYRSILARHEGVTWYPGDARFLDGHRIAVRDPGGQETTLNADRILLATGARPHVPAIPGLADTPYWTSTEALTAETFPRHLLVLGGSYVAVELAQAFRRLGSEVTLLARSTLLARVDADLGAGLCQALEVEGVQVKTGTVPRRVAWQDGTFHLETNDGTVRGDRLLVATGRTPNTEALDLPVAGVETNQRGAIRVNERLQTTAAHIHAAGDCTDLPQLVYVAAAAGTRAAANMLGGDERLDLSVLPWVVFTDPQVAGVGLTEAEAQARGVAAESRTLPLEAVPRALVNFDTRGFVKLVAERDSGRLLGAQVLAAEGGEVIQGAALALRATMTVGDLAKELFPYLTMSEALKLCAQSFDKDVTALSCCAG